MSRSRWVLIWPADFSGGGRVFFGFFGEVHGGGKTQFIGVHVRAISANGT
jgi:hypothetical protein